MDGISSALKRGGQAGLNEYGGRGSLGDGYGTESDGSSDDQAPKEKR